MIRQLSDAEEKIQQLVEQINKAPNVQRQLSEAVQSNRKHILRIEALGAQLAEMTTQSHTAQQDLKVAKKKISELDTELSTSTNAAQTDQTVAKLVLMTQKSVRLSAQNRELHDALKAAREHILAQDKLIRIHAQHTGADFSHALTSLQTTLYERNSQIEKLKVEIGETRALAKRELRLMSSAVPLGNLVV